MSQQIQHESTPEPPSSSNDATVRMARPRAVDSMGPLSAPDLGPAPPPAPAPKCAVCGHSPMTLDHVCVLSDSEQAAGQQVLVVDGRYRVESELGRGAMGVVYLARDTWLGRPVALKMIEPSWAAQSRDAASSFQREARSLASIRNQYVVQVYAFGLHGGTYFFAMEYVRGRTVRQILAEHKQNGETIPVHRTLTILGRIAQGIDAVHATGVVHRDVKPSNIAIEEHTGRPVLLDFGLAVHSDDPEAAMACGTPQYMAPEQVGLGAAAASITVRTDVYALGITAFEMLTGQLPFPTTDRAQLMRQHARKKPPALSSVRRELAPFDKIVARALAKDPDERYPSCTAFAEVLAAAGDRLISSTLPTLPPPAPEPDMGPALEWVARSLPAPSLAPYPSLARGGEPLSQRDTPHDLAGGPISSHTPPSAPSRTGDTMRPVHVLVVDDSPVFRKFTVQATQLAFYRYRSRLSVVVEGAGSGREAVERAGTLRPDLVLLDFDMPGLDGLDTLSRLRAIPGGDTARVVVVSGRVSPTHRWRFAVLGVNDFVNKPIDFRQLVDRIEGIARRFDERELDAR
ncbi:protein kinase [Minicystis rosea]|nr:protein kinase [Minicystis rosea]